MAVTAGKWSETWNQTLAQFEKTTTAVGKKHKIAGSTKWWQTNKKDAVGNAFQAADASYAKAAKKFGGAPWTASTLKSFEATVQAAEKAGDAYLAVLKTLYEKEMRARKSDKALGADYQASIKILTKEIKACQKSAIAEYMDRRLAFERSLGDKGDAGEDKRLKVVRAKLLSSSKAASVMLAKAKQAPSEYWRQKDEVLGDLTDALKQLESLDVAGGISDEIKKLQADIRGLAVAKPTQPNLTQREQNLLDMDISEAEAKRRYAAKDPEVVAYVLALKKVKEHNKIELDNALQKLRGIVEAVAKSLLKGFLDKISN